MPVRRPDGTNGTRGARGLTGQTASVATPATTSPAAASAPHPSVDGLETAPKTVDADFKLRTSSLSTSGPTKTQVPKLLDDWKKSVVEAAAEDMARAEMMPAAEQAVRALETHKGEPLTDDEVEDAVDAFFDAERPRLESLASTYHAELTKTPKTSEQAIQTVVVEQRGRVAGLRDPFTPVAQKDPAARAKEAVLWENGTAMVLVDLFSPVPKALVVPKQTMSLAQDAPKAVLDDLALLAAHVSDAFMQLTGTPPAGIWVNPPQHLTVKQLHVHVMPDLPDWHSFLGVPSPTGRPMRAVQAARDPQVAAAMQSLFQDLTRALEQKLGPAS